jgi:hypothetical protein
VTTAVKFVCAAGIRAFSIDHSLSPNPFYRELSNPPALIQIMERRSTSTNDPAPDQLPDLKHGKEETGKDGASNELSGESLGLNDAGDTEYQYVTGLKLSLVIFSVTIVAFLTMLDTSIVMTVSEPSLFESSPDSSY